MSSMRSAAELYACRLRAAAIVSALLAISGCGAPPPPVTDSSDFEIPPPSLFPITPIPDTTGIDARLVNLGKQLFHDVRLSADETVSCSSCHDPASGGDDGRQVSTGVAGRQGKLNAPTVLNSRFNFTLFWDGRAQTLEEQIVATLESPDEMDTNLTAVRAKLGNDAGLVAEFNEVYADGLTEDNILDALSAYLRALVTPQSPFDQFLSGDSGALSPDAAEGYRLFNDLGCISCHQGRNIGGNLYQRFGVMGDYFSDRGDITEVDFGRYNVTGREEDRFRFRVPSLRNVADTAPYFHDGSATTLDDAVEIMILYQLGRQVDEERRTKLVAFLESLSAPPEASLL